MERIILSYPRSGSNFLNYCLNILTGQEIPKIHGQYPSQWSAESLAGEGKQLILIIRNYKECIPRQMEKYTAQGILEHASNTKPYEKDIVPDRKGINARHADYIAMLEFFERFGGSKIFLYYEDLIANTHQELSRLCEFTGVDNKVLESFMQDIDNHQHASSQRYNKTNTGCKSISKDGSAQPIFHSKKISAQDRLSIDRQLQQKFPTLYEKYLKRYEEA